ncbi:MAG: NPCBM/NEW2 domain-containing protein [bacterium]
MKRRVLLVGILSGVTWSGLFSVTMAEETASASAKKFHEWAQTPPMGWNSYDSWGIVVPEAEVKANADYMAGKLAKYGWQYVVVDIQWYEATAKDMYCPASPVIIMDEYGRPQPATNRHPSAVNGKGFKPLADYVHNKGLKFGIHIMRGIPKPAVEKNLPIANSTWHAADAADKTRPCGWCPDMWGVDTSKPAGQAWYDALYQMFAEWGVDFVKCDDLSSPYHKGEVEAIRKAIDKTGRVIVLSTSPGATPLEQGAHVQDNANLWRISGDFWDDWRALKEQFERCHLWTPFRGPGHWPDADMLPLGYLRMWTGGEPAKFTPEEQKTMMTLWCMARSPLMIGGQMPRNDAFTESLITAGEVLDVNQKSENNRQLWRKGPLIAWAADVPGSKDKYVALFNTRDMQTFGKPLYESPIVNTNTPGQAVDIEVDVSKAKQLYLVVEDGGDGYACDHADWMEPRLETAAGEVKLTDLKWISATSGWNQPLVNRGVGGKEMKVNGQAVAHGVGTHSPSMIVYNLPEGSKRFKARGGLDAGGVEQKGRPTVRFVIYDARENADGKEKGLGVNVTWEELGLSGACRVRDLWAKKDLGLFDGSFSADVPWHGSGLYRISP